VSSPLTLISELGSPAAPLALDTFPVTDWSDIGQIYLDNAAASSQVVAEALNSPHNTWNFPSPSSTVPSLPPTRPNSPPTLDGARLLLEFTQEVFNRIRQTSRSPSPVHHSPSPVRRSPSPFLRYPSPSQLLAPLHDDNLPLLTHIPDSDSDKENQPPTDVHVPDAFQPLRPPTPVVARIPTPIPAPVDYVGLYPNLFEPPVCTAVPNTHPHQYTVVYERGEKIWVPQEFYINRDLLSSIVHFRELEDVFYPFVTPFRSQVYHEVHIHAFDVLPPTHICARVGKHPWSLNFPFGYLECSFVESIKHVFGQFPGPWLHYFENALVPLVSYDFLDGRVATLCGHLHFDERGIFVVDRSLRTEDLLFTKPDLARFVPTPRTPVNPFRFITPPPVEEPL